MFKSKTMVVFILLVIGFFSLGNLDSENSKKLDYEEIQNIVVISE